MTLELAFPDGPLADVTLVPDIKRTRGVFDDDEAKQELRARISFGEVGVERLPDPSQPQWAYEVLKFVCSFRAHPEEPFDRAWLNVALSRTDGATGRQPIAWSLAPEREVRAVQVERTLTLTPSLTLSAVSVEAGATSTRSYVADAVHLEALGEQESTAGWEFSGTPQIELRGMHRLAMVVRRDATAPAIATVSLSALVKRKKLGIVKYRASLAQKPTRDIMLGGAP